MPIFYKRNSTLIITLDTFWGIFLAIFANYLISLKETQDAVLDCKFFVLLSSIVFYGISLYKIKHLYALAEEKDRINFHNYSEGIESERHDVKYYLKRSVAPWKLWSWGALLVSAAVLFVVFLIIYLKDNPLFGDIKLNLDTWFSLIINIIQTGALYLLIAFSFKAIYSTLRFFDIAHAFSLTLGAYLVYSLTISWGLPLWVSIPISIALSILLMMMINDVFYKHLQKKGLADWQMMIISLGLYVVLQNLISIGWGDRTLSFRIWEIKAGHSVLGAHITDVQIITIAAGIFLVAVSQLLLDYTNGGRRIKASASNPELGSILGISREKAIRQSVILGTGLAAVAGILIAADIDMTPTIGFDWMMYGVVAMIIGGMGNIWHLVFGALLLAVAQHFSAFLFDSKWMDATAYIILVVFLFLRPYGFSGKKLKKTEI